MKPSFTFRQWLILFTVQFATLLFGATLTSVAVILPQMKGALSATQDQVSWIITFNLVATAIATPLTGQAVDVSSFSHSSLAEIMATLKKAAESIKKYELYNVLNESPTLGSKLFVGKPVITCNKIINAPINVPSNNFEYLFFL